MIRYDLICARGHEFDGWFSDSVSFEKQASEGDVECPSCQSNDVQKVLMTPRIAAGSNSGNDLQPVMKNAPQSQAVELVKTIRKLREHVKQDFEYVGPRFIDEARKIHNEESEARGIYGEATLQDAQDLKEEGIEVQPLPLLPEEYN